MDKQTKTFRPAMSEGGYPDVPLREQESLYTITRELLQTLRESNNNLRFSIDRIKVPEETNTKNEACDEPQTLAEILLECRRIGNSIHRSSCELSAIVGE